MWKAIFLALGIVLCIMGAECMVIEKAVFAKSPDEQQQSAPATFLLAPAPEPPPPNEIKPAEWAPWSLLSSGAVIILYSITLPRRSG